MVDRERVDAFLAHYSSQYYDPVKAHEYYLRTRELKNNQPKLQTDTQREAWAYANNQISEQRKAAKESAAKTQNDTLEQIRAKAEETRTKILDAFKERVASIMKETPIPANASPKVKAFLAKQNAQRQKRASAEVQAELKSLGDSFRTAIQNARDSYQNVQKNLDQKFATDRQQEYENIRTKVA